MKRFDDSISDLITSQLERPSGLMSSALTGSRFSDRKLLTTARREDPSSYCSQTPVTGWTTRFSHPPTSSQPSSAYRTRCPLCRKHLLQHRDRVFPTDNRRTAVRPQSHCQSASLRAGHVRRPLNGRFWVLPVSQPVGCDTLCSRQTFYLGFRYPDWISRRVAAAGGLEHVRTLPGSILRIPGRPTGVPTTRTRSY